MLIAGGISVMETMATQGNTDIMCGVKEARISPSRRHNRGSISIKPGVEKTPTPNYGRSKLGGIELITVSRVEEMALLDFKVLQCRC
jgi:hypothetical protein